MSLNFTFLRRSSISGKLKYRCIRTILGAAFIAFSFSSNAQQLSIGSPVDGIEGSTFISFVVSIDGGTVNNTGAGITGSISYSGSAINAIDYTGPAVFTIPVGANSTLVVVVVIDDNIIECDETVIATISNLNIGSVNALAGTSTALIIDDECGLVISIGLPMDGTEGLSDVSYDVYLEGGAINATGLPIVGTINYSGVALIGLDISSTPSTFTIPNGLNSTTIILPVIDDILLECDETVIATISNPSIGSIGTSTSTAIIIDNECVQSSISITTPTDGEEAVSDVSFIVSLDGGLVNGTGSDITGTLSYTGTATASLDYMEIVMFSIPNGASFTTVDIAVIDDLITEPTESVIATISAPSIGIISAFSVDTAYIIDNDSTTGFDEIILNDLNVNIYPNPVNSTMHILSEQQMKQYSIVDLNGRVMTTGKLKTKEFTLNVENLPKGFYIVRVELEDGSLATKKVLKQ